MYLCRNHTTTKNKIDKNFTIIFNLTVKNLFKNVRPKVFLYSQTHLGVGGKNGFYFYFVHKTIQSMEKIKKGVYMIYRLNVNLNSFLNT